MRGGGPIDLRDRPREVIPPGASAWVDPLPSGHNKLVHERCAQIADSLQGPDYPITGRLYRDDVGAAIRMAAEEDE